jgi:hypothetical protein
MRRLMTMVAAVGALCGMTAFGQTTPSPATTAPAAAAPAEQEQLIWRAHRDFEIIQRALREGMHDATTLQLLSQALTDRTTLLQSELNRVSQLQALVAAIQGGNGPAIREARQAVRTATESVVANARKFSEDCRAILEHLRSLHPEGRRQPPTTGAAPGATSQ